MDTVDYIVVGGGSAGCVMANRLSEDSTSTVTLLEAGDDGKGFWVDLPVGVIKLVGHAKRDWCYTTEPDPTIKNRRILWNAGKMLGGSSALNGLVYIRGQRDDYDGWERLGCHGWSFNEIFPYFLKGEHWEGEDDFQSHSRLGSLSVAPPRAEHPLATAFLTASQNYGLRKLDDYCGGDIDGVFEGVTNQHNGRRCSAAKAFIEPVRGRRNLNVRTHLQIDRILFEQRRAVGVIGRHPDGTPFEMRARREIVVCAGATQSPTLLLRSGVGPAGQLRQHGIEVIADRAGVGENLMEHMNVGLKWRINLPSLNQQVIGRFNQARAMYQYLVHGRGPLTSSLGYVMAGIRSHPDSPHPDALVFFGSFVQDPSKPSLAPGRANIFPLMKERVAAASWFAGRPYSRGRLRLRSADPNDYPIIEPFVLSDQRDIVTLTGAGRVVEGIFASPGLAEIVVERLSPKLTTDDEWEDYIRSIAGIGWHASGTCRMGSDADAVVDTRLQVKGVTGLRVADASIMPVVPSTNTNAPSMMIGEKGAAMIREDAAAAMAA